MSSSLSLNSNTAIDFDEKIDHTSYIDKKNIKTEKDGSGGPFSDSDDGGILSDDVDERKSFTPI